MERLATRPFDCKTCKVGHKGLPTPCTECMPELWPSNAQAVRIYSLVANQRIWVSNMQDTIATGLQHAPIWKLIDEFEVKDRIKTFEKVLLVFEHLIQIENNKRGAGK